MTRLQISRSCHIKTIISFTKYYSDIKYYHKYSYTPINSITIRHDQFDNYTINFPGEIEEIGLDRNTSK